MMIVQYPNDSMTVKGEREDESERPDVAGKINKMQDLMTTICDVKHQRNYARFFSYVHSWMVTLFHYPTKI